MYANERRKLAGAEALEWWDRIHNEPSSLATRQQYVDWLRETPMHAAEMLRLAQLHESLLHFENWTAIAIEESPSTESSVVHLADRARWRSSAHSAANANGGASTNANERPRRQSVAWLAAAACVLMLVAGWFLRSPADQLVQTAQAERREIALEDGSVVQLDPQSRLRVRLESGVRRVNLEQGRAVFHVAKDAVRPFLVHAQGTVVRAVGTAFGVEVRATQLVVTVAEGRVSVAPESGLPQSAANFLHANQQVVVTAGVSGPVRDVDSSRELAWADGRLIFDDQSLADVVQEFNRYNRVQLRIDAPRVAARTISGVFNATDPASFVAFVEAGGAARAARQADQSIVLTE